MCFKDKNIYLIDFEVFCIYRILWQLTKLRIPGLFKHEPFLLN